VSGTDDYGPHDYPHDGHDPADSEHTYELDDGRDEHDTPLLDDDYAHSHVDAENADRFHDFGAPAEGDHSGQTPAALSPHSMPGPSWLPGVDPFADHTPAVNDDDSYAAALHADYTATWTSDLSDHTAPVWDGAASARLADLMPHPGAGVDAALLGGFAQSPDSMAAELWREGLPAEPLPVDPNGHVLGAREVLDQLNARLRDPAQSDVARAVRQSMAS